MSEIPADIMKAAYDCARGIYLNVDDAGAPYLTTDDIEEIAKAILAERERCTEAAIDKIVSDTSPVEPNSTDVLIAKLGIAQGQNRMMADALEKSLHIMCSYQRIGYGDDVYMSTLCDAIRHAERALDNFKVDLPTNPTTKGARA